LLTQSNFFVYFLFQSAMKASSSNACMQVILSLAHSIATDERWINDSPQEFKPERWLRREGSAAGAWVPFGGGHRFCLGWQVSRAKYNQALHTVLHHHYSIH
jgi:cytochrome P450